MRKLFTENNFSETFVLQSLTLTLVRLIDKEVLLESCCFLLTYHQEQIKRRRKVTPVREIILKRIEQGVYHNLLQEIRVYGRESYFRLFV